MAQPLQTTRFDDARFDAETFGFDVDLQVYVNPNSIELNLKRIADPKLVRRNE